MKFKAICELEVQSQYILRCHVDNSGEKLDQIQCLGDCRNSAGEKKSYREIYTKS